MSIESEIETPASYQETLVANYDQLREQRDWTVEQMGDHIETVDPSLAAEYRKQHPASAKAAPKGRSAAPKSEA